MAIRRVEHIIDLSRKGTENVDFTDTTGIQQDEFIQYLNDAQRRLESMIQVQFPQAFLTTKTEQINANTEFVTLPEDIYMNQRAKLFEFSRLLVDTNSTQDFYILKQGSFQEKISGFTGEPSFYIRQGNQIRFSPIPQTTGRLRTTYQKRFPTLDIRRGELESLTLTSTQLTALKLDESSTKAALDVSGLEEENTLTIIDKNGNIKMKSVEFESIDADGTVNLTGSAFTFAEDETAAVGNFVCRGGVSTNVSELPDIAERYLLSYLNWKILKRDSNVDSGEAQTELTAMESDILQAYAEPTGDVDYIPILDSQYLDPEDEVF